jgi:hypothetical protein
MKQIGLAKTLELLAAGYKKKDIEALAALDEQATEEQQEDIPEPSQLPDPEPEKEADPDYKAKWEDATNKMNELQEKLKESEDRLKKLQQENINRDSGPAAAEAKQKETDSLLNMVKSFM